MRKLITFSITVVTLSILFASCGSSLSITKRHYNKGYYISSNFRKQAVSTPKEEENLTQSEVNESTYSPNSQKENTKLVNQSEDNVFSDVPALTSIDEDELAQEQRENSIIKNTKQVAKNIFAPAKNIKSSIADKKIKSTPASDGDGLSFLWIVIIVLLILWALGLISGNFGGLVHILLVIALILLILWLLRII